MRSEPETDHDEPHVQSHALPEWVEHLPGFLGSMVKRYGWLVGVRMAISGLAFSAIGVLARVMFKRMTAFHPGSFSGGANFEPSVNFGDFSITGIGGVDPFTSFQNSTWDMASTYTGFIIGLSLVITAAGVVLAIVLKKWGDREK